MMAWNSIGAATGEAGHAARRTASIAALLVLALALGVPSGATTAPIEFHAVIDASHGQPPYNGSPVRGVGRFTLNDAQDLLSYDILFDPWITTTEIASHIHLDSSGVEFHDLPNGPHKVGSLVIDSPIILQALFDGILFVRVHSQAVRNGEVGGWIEAGTPAGTASWGRLKALYR